MGEKTQKNLAMGYSAAYPTRAERCLEVEEWVSLDWVSGGVGD